MDVAGISRSGSTRAARTRSALLSAGLELLVDRSVDGIPIDELVATAGVGKGSFFNHFDDKQAFADAVGAKVRTELEAWVCDINHGVTDPLRRLTGGMIAACCYAQAQPRRTMVMARTSRVMMLEDHPLNRQLLCDLKGVVASGMAFPPSLPSAVTFWLACCHGVMARIVECRADTEQTVQLVREMLLLALRGLGVPQHFVEPIVEPTALRGQLGNNGQRLSHAHDGGVCAGN